jgi:hypothetical protein
MEVLMDAADIDELYTLPPERFTEARNELAKRLKESGDAEGAGEIRLLRRPTVAAWALNQLARQQAAEIKALISAGEDLRRAQERTLAGEGRTELRDATDRRKHVVESLVEAASELLRAEGRAGSSALFEDVSNTLLATATDEEVADALRQGRLDKEAPAPAGFGELAAFATVPKRPSRERRSASASSERKEDTARKREEEKARARAGQLSADADDEEEEASRLREEAAQAEAATAQARKEADRARRAAERADARATKARDRADRATGDVRERFGS